jgi:4-hydroxy-2-oxoheptanedioate aldolase
VKVVTESLRRDSPIHGFWLTNAHPTIVEVTSELKPDFVCLDAQHGTHLSQLTSQAFTTMAQYEVPGLVRVARNDPSDIGRALDLGAAGVMVPMIETADEAGEAVAAFNYGPEGTRSYGMQTSRVDPMSPDYAPICAVQVETAAAVSNIEGIAAVEGVDWLYVGPADLGLGLGGVPAPDVNSVFEREHPLADELLAAFSAVVGAASNYGKLAGLHCGSGEATLLAEEFGFTVASVAGDLGEIRAGLDRQLSVARSSGGQDSDH